MFSKLPTVSAIAAFAALATASATPSYALSMKDCSAKYSAAKAAGTLAGKSWTDFRRAECAGETNKTAAAPAPEQKKVAEAPSARAEQPAKVKKAKVAAATPAPAAAEKPVTKAAPAPSANISGAVFPKKIAAAYAQESAGKGRMHTCLDQYKANKATNANGGLEWIQKGGGYYSVCNKQLKSSGV